MITLADLLDPANRISVTAPADALGSQGGFDTQTASVDTDLSRLFTETTLTENPSLHHYGVWGEYGYVNLQFAEGPMSGQIRDVPFTGDLGFATVYVMGDATGTNPEGMGSATWSGAAEAVSTSTFQRRQGTATLTIADLSRPRVGVEVDIAGFAIGSSRWSDIPLTTGRFATGSVGSDYLEGNFHGPNHEEAYGVFDTGAHMGGFGAKRTQ